MATILYRLTNLMQANALTLGNESWARKLPSGANWTRIRIGFLFSIGGANTRAANIVDWGLTFGVGSSVPFMPGNYRCPNMVGACPAGEPTPGSLNTLTYTSTAFAGWQSSGVSPRFFQRLFDPASGPIWGLATSSSSAVAYAPDPAMTTIVPNPKRNSMLVLDIQKGMGGAGTALMTLYYQVIANTQAGYWFTESDLMDAVSSLGTPIIQGLTFTTTTAQSLSVSDATGPLDTVFISHNKDSVPINIMAIASCVSLDQPTIGIGGGNDNFTNYGTQAFPAYTTSGSMSQGEWYGTEASSWLLYGTGWDGVSMRPQSLAGTTMTVPYDTFTQYQVSNTLLTTQISAGTGWSAAATFTGTDQGYLPQRGLAGTSTTIPFDLLTQYFVSGGTFTGDTVLVAGTGWGNNGDISGTVAPWQRELGLAGTSTTIPFDLLTQYFVTGGTFSGAYTLTAGTGWDSWGTVTGTIAPAFRELGYSGTSTGLPFDLMVEYEPGAVTSGVTINAGTGWAGAGVIV